VPADPLALVGEHPGMRMTYLSVSSPSWAVTRFLREKVISATTRAVLAPFVGEALISTDA